MEFVSFFRRFRLSCFKDQWALLKVRVGTTHLLERLRKKREYVKDKVESINKVRERAHAPYRKRKFVGEKFRLTGKQALLSWR